MLGMWGILRGGVRIGYRGCGMLGFVVRVFMVGVGGRGKGAGGVGAGV